MKSILFGIVVLLALQGCSYIDEVSMSSRSINSCSSVFHPINEKQCKKDKETLNKILGKGGLEVENMQRGLLSVGVYVVPVIALGVYGLSK